MISATNATVIKSNLKEKGPAISGQVPGRDRGIEWRQDEKGRSSLEKGKAREITEGPFVNTADKGLPKTRLCRATISKIQRTQSKIPKTC